MGLVKLPAAYAPQFAIAFGAVGADVTAVDQDTPLPVEVRARQAASTAAPVTGSLTMSGQSGAFTPELGRPIWLRLSGSWTGTVALERRLDAGSWYPVTLGGEPLSWTANRNEPVYEESVAGAQYRLNFASSGGTLDYEVRQ
jgi:hypothetical protein